MHSSSFREEYDIETRWQGKVHIMDIFHLSQIFYDSKWTLAKTADYFGVSIALVSENLKLCRKMFSDDKILKCESRNEALKRIK